MDKPLQPTDVLLELRLQKAVLDMEQTPSQFVLLLDEVLLGFLNRLLCYC